MAATSPVSRIFASLQPANSSALHTGDLENRAGIVVGQHGGREVQVSGSAELSAAPDRAQVCIAVSSSKGTAAEAKSSVQRRLEYIAQSLRQGGVTEENITVSKEFQRLSNTYKMEAVVCVVFSDFDKLQSNCNLLVEKLDSSVNISPPHFYHTADCLEKLRREVCLGAVANARRKAQEVCRLVGHSLGKALIIREEELREWEDQAESSQAHQSIQSKIKTATIYAASKILATFEIKGKERHKKNR
ncbi:interleukin-1 receptor-associated kinase 1-binding protein 1 homolog [Xenopus laevis]|uniref:Interleukin-1 receptor-associated kinase 1-binding protein 1 homolog n=2 Tax=Xenopus laevis TaxID=8355 RepID=IKBP1_XENLA|nr:interleukin-1 receptor-associated kinase 1-binding protein 1 homolog [Xenopus laevis]Q08AV8.1 RecName: Full=Interleukin-1 receptor-associated kinase 1-binding protein 1 homolog [Xenopus laevis]AAI24990.1 Irak1bp1 protein [Xenopus laevis]OCT78333.1 hypothetical protein XELAEV_18029442mg [Xenopus laevis]